MIKFKNKNAITLIALVITIVIMLLLAAVAIQLTLGENGLISKSTQAKSQQAKSELYETAKLEYLNLKIKSIESGLPIPSVESILSETSFLNKYNVIGNNITNKNGEIIETKDNLINFLKEDPSSPPSTPSIPLENQPYQVSNEDKDKLIIRYKYNDGISPLKLLTTRYNGYSIDWRRWNNR